MDLEGAVAVVTGGGTGIGRAVCESLARAGARAIVVNYSRSRDEAEATAAALEKRGCTALPHQASVADDAAVRAMVADAESRFGRLDVLVSNAGTTHFIPHPDLDALTEEVWDELLSVNLKGTFYCARAAAPALRRTRGAIVNEVVERLELRGRRVDPVGHVGQPVLERDPLRVVADPGRLAPHPLAPVGEQALTRCNWASRPDWSPPAGSGRGSASSPRPTRRSAWRPPRRWAAWRRRRTWPRP